MSSTKIIVFLLNVYNVLTKVTLALRVKHVMVHAWRFGNKWKEKLKNHYKFNL